MYLYDNSDFEIDGCPFTTELLEAAGLSDGKAINTTWDGNNNPTYSFATYSDELDKVCVSLKADDRSGTFATGGFKEGFAISDGCGYIKG